MRKGMEPTSPLYLAGRAGCKPYRVGGRRHKTFIRELGKFSLFDERVHASFPRRHLKSEIRNGQRQLGGKKKKKKVSQKKFKRLPRENGRAGGRSTITAPYLRHDDGRQAFEVLDMREQRVSQRVVGIGRKLVEGSLDLHLHGLSGKVTRLHVLLELQQLVRDLPRVHLQRRKTAARRVPST